MNDRQKIIHAFSLTNHSQDSLLSKQILEDSLNLLVSQNTTLLQFSSEIADELWDNTELKHNKYIRVQDFADTVVEAIKILRYQFNAFQKQLKNHLQPQSRKRKLIEFYAIYEELQLLLQCFKIPGLPQSIYLKEALEVIPQHYKNKNNNIFATQPNFETTGMQLVLWIAMLSLGLQIIMMFHKQHFYTLLTLCAVLCIFFLNYFDSTYIRIVIYNLIVSSIFDMIWEISKARNYWMQEGGALTSSMQSHYLKFITIFVVIVAVGKLMMASILFKYRNNPPTMKKNVQFLQLRFNLDGDPYNNPISLLFIQ